MFRVQRYLLLISQTFNHPQIYFSYVKGFTPTLIWASTPAKRGSSSSTSILTAYDPGDNLNPSTLSSAAPPPLPCKGSWSIVFSRTTSLCGPLNLVTFNRSRMPLCGFRGMPPPPLTSSTRLFSRTTLGSSKATPPPGYVIAISTVHPLSRSTEISRATKDPALSNEMDGYSDSAAILPLPKTVNAKAQEINMPCIAFLLAFIVNQTCLVKFLTTAPHTLLPRW